MRIRWIRAFVLSPLFPYVLQAMALVAFVGLAVFGWGRFSPEGVASKLYAKVNLVNLLIWGLWWPVMVWVAVLFGRLWCAVCPLELVANLAERLGRVLGIGQRKVGRWLQSGIVILGFYALIQMLVVTVHLHRVPAYTSLFLWAMLTVAAVVGFVYKDRAFCRAFCPVGLLLGTYGRGSMLVVRPVSQQSCDNCTGKDCVAPAHRTRYDRRSCPSLLNPAKLHSDSSDCLVCGQCIKTCAPVNMGVLLRPPFHVSDARQAMASWPVTLFVMLVSGFVGYELCSEWGAAKGVFLWVPTLVCSQLGLEESNGWIKGLWMLLVFPSLLWTLLGLPVLLLGGARNLLEAWRRLALPLAVVIAAGHMAKGLAKISSWGSYLPHVLEEPSGVKNALALTTGALDKPAALLPMPLVSLVGVALVLTMGWFALRESRLADPQTHRARILSIVSITSIATMLTFGWGFLS